MSAKANRTGKLQSTVIISNRFSERRSIDAARVAEGSSAEPLEAGSMVGRYLTLSRIGVGGMGVVYRAHDTKLNRTVALKVLPPRLCKFPEYLRRFHTEAQAQARLNSPNIITLHELMAHPAGEILVLEYVEGETLESRLRQRGPLSLPEAVRIFEQTLLGVEHVHQMGVIHRDLKPSNIFITHDHQIKLMDFGIARLLDNHDTSQNGTMVGTLLYISPEQINGRETDGRSDVYTLGISLFEAVTGRLPFERRSDYALMHAHVQENPPSPKEFQRRLPPELEWIILKAIEKDPNQRFQSVAEFRAALLELRVADRRHPTAARSGRQASWRHPARTPGNRIWGGIWMDLSLAATVLLFVTALGIFPTPKPSVENLMADSAHMKKVVRQSSIRVAAKPMPVMLSNNRVTKVQATKQSKDNLATLRDAWGG